MTCPRAIARCGLDRDGDTVLGRLLTRYALKRYWPWLIAVLVFEVAGVLAQLYIPTLNKSIIDHGIRTGDVAFIWGTGGMMLLVAIGQLAAAVIATFFGARTAMATGRDIRGDVFEKVSGFSEREVSQFGPGSLITRTTNDVQQVQMLVMMGSTMLVMAPLMAIGGIIMALREDAGLAWIIAVAVPLLLIIAGLIVSRMVPQFRAMQRKLDRVNLVMREQLTGVRVVRAFVREDIEADRFRDANTDIRIVGRKIGTLFVTLFPLVMFVLNIAVVAVIWFGAQQISAGHTQLGTVVAYMQYVSLILMGITMASFMAVMIPRAAVSADRIGEVLDTDTSLHLPEHPVTEFTERGTIELRGATFTYPGADAPVLSDVSFRAEQGQTVAVVGSTGAGKTTLVSLLPRLFDATSGEVLVDGVNVSEADPDQLWQRIGLVPQRSYLFSGTIASNLRFGREDATDDELWRALEIAQGADFVRRLEGQLQAPISQGGTNVSGGQRQRLAIARAIVRNPEILIFDDSFSALDLATDAKLRRALWEQLPQTTKLVVAQRVSTITDADRIIVLEDGRMVGSGTHEQLLASSETYREIVESQLGVDA